MVVVVFTRANRGGSVQHNTRNTDPSKPRIDESLALCHPYLQQRCIVHPFRPACAQQDGENFPIGADPSGSFFASSYTTRLPICDGGHAVCLVI